MSILEVIVIFDIK